MSKDSGNKSQVLFVDDDRGFLEMIERVTTLWSKGSWEVFLAESTGKALNLIQSHTFSLIVVDVEMPVVDGPQFMNLVHRLDPNLRKVALTGFASEEKRAACLSSGAEMFLEKPTTIEGMETLYQTLAELARWDSDTGFRGVVRRAGLEDVLQMECLARSSSILEVVTEQLQGTIYIQDGAIVHAVAGNVKGTHAFNHILSLKGGEFKLKSFQDPPEKTIEGAWEFLLMEAARLKDELANTSEESGLPAAPDPPIQPEPEFESTPNEIRQLSENPPASEPARGESAFAREPLEESLPTSNLEDEIVPTQIDEFLVCSTHGDVLYQWQCPDSEVRIEFLEFLSQRARQLEQLLPLGKFDRLEMESGRSRMVAQLEDSRAVVLRSSKIDLELPSHSN